MMEKLRCRRGQGLMEYLLLVVLICATSIAVVGVVGQNIKAQFASVSAALRGEAQPKKDLVEADASTYQLRGMDDAFESAHSKKR
jgi:pilus assembly protein Flp/PilA